MTVPGSGSNRRKRLKALREAALHRPVLARHLSDGFNGRWSRRQWMTASLFASMGLLVAAIVPGFNQDLTTPTAAPRQSMALALPPLPVSRGAQGVEGDSWQIVSVRSGQTLGQLFEEMGVPAATLHRILEQPSAKAALGRLRPGTELAFDLPVNGALRAFRFDQDDMHRVELTLDGDAIRENVIARPVETRTTVATGEITSSLYAAARKAGLSPATIAVMTDQIFQYDIDFNSDIQRGDRFSVVMDETWREGERIGRGKVLAATFTTGGKTYSGFRFEHDGTAEYFSADGRPLKKAFIRMPIPFARVTSGFSRARKHPVLGRVRRHDGVDYGARSGTQIMAAGDARVQFVGWKGGYGRTVILDHGRGNTTLYAHMSRFGKYKVGQRVPQGAVIGYVGASGLATGPHLHYEFRVNGVHRNPLTVTMPPPEPLKGAQLAAFRAQTGPALARIEQFEKLIYARTGADAGQVASAEATTPGGEG
ncbi:peptidoglycan DD-metalloendopeptidase family protein [Marilutibacter aestuarii]|uniref:Peptidoglycan DD-metalloendopeptidase family protein n=1 Tax=Marilutibacter aestuarii TaxID=1706195 RepID=A0A508AMB7_9GAMM|nr:peptidoglycan DD-metalloendopeptidase family protein [Lysobacter aestuarii]TQD51076.1 peptidoglycan DD-metalloendopeptidase family protein [Lysobacter aestuarii]